MAGSVERARSVSSMRSRNFPPRPRAYSQLNSAVRPPPICRKPVGEGAKRVTISDMRLGTRGKRAPVYHRRTQPAICLGRGTLLSISQNVFFREGSDLTSARTVAIARAVLAVDWACALEVLTQKDLTHHLGDQHHADVFAEAFVRAEAEIEVVIPVPVRIKHVRIVVRIGIEHCRLREDEHIRALTDQRLVFCSLGNAVIL